MLNKLRTIGRAVAFVIFAFVLSSCTSVVCLSGLCPSPQEVAARIPWDPPSLSQQNCLDNIFGKYRPKDLDGNTGDLDVQFPTVSYWISLIDVTYEKREAIPRSLVPKPTKEDPNRMVRDDSEFYNSAYVLIEQGVNGLVVSLIDGNGTLYVKKTISLNLPMVGCANGDFIIRMVSMSGGADFTGSSMHTTERRFRKLDDGNLQVMTLWRTWSYHNISGIKDVPYSARRDALIFPPYNN